MKILLKIITLLSASFILILGINYALDEYYKYDCSQQNTKESLKKCIFFEKIDEYDSFYYDVLSKKINFITINESNGDTYLLNIYRKVMPQNKENINFVMKEYEKCRKINNNCLNHYIEFYYLPNVDYNEKNKPSESDLMLVKKLHEDYLDGNKIFEQSNRCLLTLEYSNYRFFTQEFNLINKYIEIEKQFKKDHFDGKNYIKKCKY